LGKTPRKPCRRIPQERGGALAAATRGCRALAAGRMTPIALRRG
jgi:hypothetical protein